MKAVATAAFWCLVCATAPLQGQHLALPKLALGMSSVPKLAVPSSASRLQSVPIGIYLPRIRLPHIRLPGVLALAGGGIVGSATGMGVGIAMGGAVDRPGGMIIGLVAGEALGMALGVHLANHRRGNLALDAAVSVGILGVFAIPLALAAVLAPPAASGSEGSLPPQILLVVPIAQLFGTIKAERSSGRSTERQ